MTVTNFDDGRVSDWPALVWIDVNSGTGQTTRPVYTHIKERESAYGAASQKRPPHSHFLEARGIRNNGSLLTLNP